MSVYLLFYFLCALFYPLNLLCKEMRCLNKIIIIIIKALLKITTPDFTGTLRELLSHALEISYRFDLEPYPLQDKDIFPSLKTII